MNIALAALAALAIVAPGPFRASGNAYHYYRHLMEHVAQVRVRQGLIAAVRRDVDGYASTRSCANIGKILTARFADSPQVERFQIVDCSNPRDYARQNELADVAEFDFPTAQRHPALLLNGHLAVQVVAITDN